MMREMNWRAAIAVISVGLALSSAHAQSTASRKPPAAQGYRVAGTVVNRVTGEPVRGAAVSLITVPDNLVVATTESGDDGRFAMDGLSAAKYELAASKRGYSTGLYNQHWEYNSAIVTGVDQDTSQLVFKLSPAAEIVGVVTGDGGDPVENASVMLFERPHRHLPGEKTELAQTVQTDDTGAYEFAGLDPGDYLVAVKARPWYAVNLPAPETQNGESSTLAALDVAYPVTYFDSTTDEGSASDIALAVGAREEADINIHAVPSLHLQVPSRTRPDGSQVQPQLEQTVFGIAVDGDENQVGDAPTRTSELFGVAPGHYELTQGDPPRVVELDATSSQQVDPLAGVPTESVAGVVETAPGVPYSGRGVVMLVSADGTGPTVAPTQNDHGSFKLNNVPAGSWLVEVMGQDAQLPVLAVGPRSGHAQAGNQITVDGSSLSLNVTVSAGNARIEGFVRRNGKSVAGAMVVLVPKDLSQMAELARRDQSDSDGSFALLNAAPGDYTIVAIEDAWEMNWFDRAVISRYLPRGIAVTVKGQSEKVQRLNQPVELQAR